MPFFKIFRDCSGICIAVAIIIVLLLSEISIAEESDGIAPVKPAGEARTESLQNQAAQPAPPDRISGEYIKGYVNDTGRMLASPINWNGGDWLKAGLVIGAASGLYLADADVRNFAQKNQSSTGDTGADVGNFLGNPLYAVPSLGLFYLYGHLAEDPKARRASLLAVESLAISGAFTMTIKLATRRPRPDTGESSTTWNSHGTKSTNSSFPSIHTQTAFSIAAVLAEEYGTNTYVPTIAYGLATLVGLSRVYDDKHWASDAFIGAAIGYVVGKAVVRYHTLQSDAPLKILPTVGQQGFGVMAEYRF